MLLFVMSSVNSASFWDLGCWFNQNPNMEVDLLIYNESGSFKSSVTQGNGNEIDTLSIIEGDIIQIDFSPTSDDENNIRQERVFFLHDTKSDWTIDIQDNNNVQTLLSTTSSSSNKFDFYEYLNTGISKPQYFSEHTQTLTINGNPQNDLIKTFKPQIGNYEVLFRVTDDCSNDATDEVYKFFDLVVEPKPSTSQTVYVCNSTSTVSVANPVATTWIDIYIDNGCGNALDFSSVTNSGFLNINLRTHENNTLVEFPAFNCGYQHNIGNSVINYIPNLRIYGNDFYNIHQCVQTFSYFTGATGNENITIDYNSGNQYSESFGLGYFGNFNKVKLISSYGEGGMGYLRINGYIGNVKDLSLNITGSGYMDTPYTYDGNVNITYDNSVQNYISFRNSYNNVYSGFNQGINFNIYGDYHNNNLYYGYNSNGFDNIDLTNNGNVYLNSILIGDNYVGNANPVILQKRWGEPSIKMYANVLQYKNSNAFSIQDWDSGSYNYTISKEISTGNFLGNAWLNENGTDIFNCNVALKNITFENKVYTTCSSPIMIAEDTSNGVKRIYDYIIVTNQSKGGYNPSVPEQIIIPNNKPVANIKLNSTQEVEVGQTVCWDTSDSFDTDGSIVSKKIWEGDKYYSNLDSNCLTKTSPDVVSVKVEVTDNDGAKDDDIVYIKWSKTQAICQDNTPSDLVITNTQYQNNMYWLNMTVSDFDGDTDFTYAWTVNGETVYGKDILTSIDYNQNIYGSVFDGCNITSDMMYIDVGQNYSEPINSIDINLVCSQNNIYSPSTVSCELIKDLKNQHQNTIIWLYDTTIINENQNASIFSRSVGDINDHLITVSVSTIEGEYKTDYYRFNLVPQPITPPVSGGGGGSTPITKTTCNINITPIVISISDNNLTIPLTIKNNEQGSWQPDYIFEDVVGFDSVKDDLSLANTIGTIEATQTKVIGVKYNKDLFDTNPITAKNKIRFTSDNCEDVILIINTNINNQETILAFSELDLLSSLKPENFIELTAIKKELIVDNKELQDLKVWHIGVIVLLIFITMLWNVRYVDSDFGNIVSKSLIIILLTSIITTIIIYGLNYLFKIL